MMSRNSNPLFSKLRKVHAICDAHSDLRAAFDDVREDAKHLKAPISIDLTSRCNLFCEGCYYYEGNDQAMTDEEDAAKWRAFFKAQAENGTKYLYIAGAEPALHPERLRAAADYVSNGIIAANGTIKIDPDIPYRIAVSVWGGPDVTAKLRGGGTFWKALRNYARDPRALFSYTINSQNIGEIREVAHIMKDQGAQMTFNMYSPTESYLSKIARGVENDDAFFRFSSEHDNLAFKSDDLKRCREEVDEIIDDFQGTVVYPSAFNHEVTIDGPLFDIDENTGIATNCAGLHNGTHKTILSTLKESPNKCCIPNIDCKTCRLLANVLPSRLAPYDKDVQDAQAVRNWLNIRRYWSWFYLKKPYVELRAPATSSVLNQDRQNVPAQ